jgi:hypothetical protein
LPAESSQLDRLDTASSVVISIAEAPMMTVTISDTQPASQSVELAPSNAIAEAADTLSDASIVVETSAPASPITSYAVRRARNRRNQLQITIALLLAVIVLAVVLIWVLRRGGEQPSAAMAVRHQLVELV